ncbi:MAG: universal stress protein [Salegentibacter sp.]|uniref:universal stress protein n=1 Tax=Salegentibacter sp. TaxID=1903072 RepID=UPI0028701D66|nr:universal stress protein [Salegentibacter sp.]MDR9458046.1 universal stress protein [Salegentibacter sp.]
MNVLLLSDFSEVAINATHYAMDLLREEKVSFILLNIYVPDPDASEEEKERKRTATKARLQERVDKLRERSLDRPHCVNGHYSEDNLINTTRDFLVKNKIDLLVMGAVGKDMRHATILGDHTFEIISKIKCNILAVPEDVQFREIQRILMPIDTSVSLHSKNLQFLKESNFLHNTQLSVWELGNTKAPDKNSLKISAFENLDQMQIDFFKLNDVESYDKSIWMEVQKKFDVISLLAKNIQICSHLMHSKHGFYLTAPNRLPIFVLHD